MFFSFSIIVDIIWLIVIAWKTWFDSAYEKLAPWEHSIHVLTLILVLINLFLKIISVALSFLYESKVKQTFQTSYNATMKNFKQP